MKSAINTESLLEELRQNYLAALPSKIDDIENTVLLMDKSPRPEAVFAQLFRQVHSLKGSGGTYGIHIISSICHQLEDNLQSHEQQGLKFEGEDIDQILSYIDLLRDAIESVAKNNALFDVIEKRLQELKEKSNENLISVLLVEPSKTTRHLVAETLREMGAKASWVTDGRLALERLQSEKFDLLISSRETPFYNGLAIIAANKLNKGINHKIPTIIITSNPQELQSSPFQPDNTVARDKNLTKNLATLIKEFA